MLPMLTREVVEKHGWITEEELLDYYAIGQCTPGIIAVNTATFVGFKENGVTGAAFSTTGIVAPSYIIITLIASLLSRYMDAPVIAHALAGIRIMVSAILLNMVFNLVRKTSGPSSEYCSIWRGWLWCFSPVFPPLLSSSAPR